MGKKTRAGKSRGAGVKPTPVKPLKHAAITKTSRTTSDQQRPQDRGTENRSADSDCAPIPELAEEPIDHIPFNFGYLDESEADTFIDKMYFEWDRFDPEQLSALASCPIVQRADKEVKALVKSIDADPTKLPILRYSLHPLLRCMAEYSPLPEAAATLLAVCEYCIRHLESLDIDDLKRFAQHRHLWPAFVAASDLKIQTPTKNYRASDRLRDLRHRLESLGLGKETEVMELRSASESNTLAILLIDTIKENQKHQDLKSQIARNNPAALKRRAVSRTPDWVKQCVQLPPLKEKDAWEKWFDVGWQAVLEATNGHPEQHAKLRPLGLHREQHSVREGAQKRITARTAEANIRDGIKKALKAAFKRLTVRAPS